MTMNNQDCYTQGWVDATRGLADAIRKDIVNDKDAMYMRDVELWLRREADRIEKQWKK